MRELAAIGADGPSAFYLPETIGLFTLSEELVKPYQASGDHADRANPIEKLTPRLPRIAA